MHQLGLDTSSFQAIAAQLGEEGKTPLYVAIDQQLAAIIAVADPIKETTYAAIDTFTSAWVKGCHDYWRQPSYGESNCQKAEH